MSHEASCEYCGATLCRDVDGDLIKCKCRPLRLRIRHGLNSFFSEWKDGFREHPFKTLIMLPIAVPVYVAILVFPVLWVSFVAGLMCIFLYVFAKFAGEMLGRF